MNFSTQGNGPGLAIRAPIWTAPVPSPGGRRARQEYQPPSNTFTQEQHVGSPSAVNGNQPNFTQQLARGNSSTPESQHPSPSKPTGNSGHQRAPGLIYPCGAVSVKFAVWACDYCLKNQGYPVRLHPRRHGATGGGNDG
uniref:Uncharacterized protein n=1 Tax=Xenopus tropicalis TaxID=8364 RepID=A0A803JLE1_XENTR